jgi:hypothetical protein
MSQVYCYHISHNEAHCHYLLAWSSLCFFSSLALSSKKERLRPIKLQHHRLSERTFFLLHTKKQNNKKINEILLYTQIKIFKILTHSKTNIHLG